MIYHFNQNSNIKIDKTIVDKRDLPEKIMVDFDNLVVNTDERIIYTLLKSKFFKNLYKDIIDYELIKSTEPNKLIINKNSSNIVNDFILDNNIDTYRLRDTIINKYIDFYAKCNTTLITEFLLDMIKDPKIKFEKLYIWHPTLDHRVTIKCEEIFKEYSSFVEIFFGDKDVLYSDKTITSFILEDIYDINNLILHHNMKYTDILIPRFRSNYKEEDGKYVTIFDLNDLIIEYGCKIGITNTNILVEEIFDYGK